MREDQNNDGLSHTITLGHIGVCVPGEDDGSRTQITSNTSSEDVYNSIKYSP